MKRTTTTTVIVNYIPFTSDDYCHCQWMVLIPNENLLDMIKRISNIIYFNNLDYAVPNYKEMSEVIKNSYWIFDCMNEYNKNVQYLALIEKFETLKKQTDNEYFITELTATELKTIQLFDNESGDLRIRKDDFLFKLETDCNWYETDSIPIDFLQINTTQFLTNKTN